MVTHFTDETVEGEVKCKACPGNTSIHFSLLFDDEGEPVTNLTIDSCVACPDGGMGKRIPGKEVWKTYWDIYKVDGVDTCIC
jgi:hypothetical protein